jgi:hypothetical protein
MGAVVREVQTVLEIGIQAARLLQVVTTVAAVADKVMITKIIQVLMVVVAQCVSYGATAGHSHLQILPMYNLPIINISIVNNFINRKRIRN